MTEVDRRAFFGLAAAAVGTAAIAQTGPAGASLKGMSVLITGTSSGFGRLTAIECAKRGATVFATMRNLTPAKGKMRGEAEELMSLAKAGNWQGFTLLDLDITDEREIASAVAKAQQQARGALDAVVNNAGIGIGGPVETADAEALMMALNTNTLGAMRVARAALPAMRERKRGLVVNVSSQLGRIVAPNMGIYGASKFALECLSETMAYELAPHGVEVTVVQPGGYPTNIWKTGVKNSEAMLNRQDRARLAAYDPLVTRARAMGQGGGGSTDPNDVARAIADLIALPPGQRPLRRPVHPNTRATDAVNAACAQVQAAVLGQGPYADWHKAVAS